MIKKTNEKEYYSSVALRITLKAYEHDILDTVCKNISDVGKYVTAEGRCSDHHYLCQDGPKGSKEEGIKGPIPLPTRTRRYCVLTSPHVYKKARDHFEIRTHKRIIELVKPSRKGGAYLLLEKLKGLEIPAGVDIKIKKVKRRK
jgi:small subunit ribosomal protein S10